MIDRDLDFPTDSQRHPCEHVERIDNPTVGAIFDRHDAVFGMTPVHLLEHRSDRVHRNQVSPLAKSLNRRQVRIAELGTEIGHPRSLYRSAGCTQQLAIDTTEGSKGQRARLLFQLCPQGIVSHRIVQCPLLVRQR